MEKSELVAVLGFLSLTLKFLIFSAKFIQSDKVQSKLRASNAMLNKYKCTL